MSVYKQIDLTNKVAIVTGGTGWLGHQITESLHELGAVVFVLSRGESVDFSKINDGRVYYVDCDIADKQDVDTFFKFAELRGFTEFDILVNNAHRWSKNVNFLVDDENDFNSTMTMGINAQLSITRIILNSMIKRGKGNIINVCSMYSRCAPDLRMYKDSGRGSAIEYGVVKAGLAQATKYIASLGGPHGVRCNSISPGPFPRPGTFDNGFEWFKEELTKRTMLQRVGSCEEIKGIIAFLASDMSSYVTGVDIPIDGGWTAL